MKDLRYLLRLAREGSDFRHWYHHAHHDILTVCYQNKWPVVKFTDVLAILSPRITVTRNVKAAIAYMETGQVLPDLVRSTHQAMAHYEETGEIRGPKTSAFARALRLDEEAIVLDSWMSVALGVEHRKLATKRVRHSAERRIRYASHLMGWMPAQFQAAVWSAAVLRAGRNVPALNPVAIMADPVGENS